MLTSLRAILRTAAKSLGVERAAYAAEIEEIWPEIVGARAAEHTRPAGLRGATLVVDTAPGLWVQELTAQRAKVVGEINRRLGGSVIDDIRFRQRPVRPGSSRTRATGAPTSTVAQPGSPPELSPGEIAAIEQAMAEIKDPEIREAARKAMVSQAHWKKRQGR